MTMPGVALLISAISVCIALFSLGWNVYRDVILKPKVKVTLQVVEIFTPGHPEEERPVKVSIRATNFGPGNINLEGLQSKNQKLLRKTRHGILFHDFEDPLSQHFPCKLEVGASATYLMPFRKGIFLKSHFTHFGIADSFGRVHWASKKDIKRAKKEYEKQFGKYDNSERGQ